MADRKGTGEGLSSDSRKPRVSVKLSVAFLHDVAASALAWYLAFLLRFNFDIAPQYFADMLHSLAWVVPIQALVSWRLNLYRGVWRFASLNDVKRILLAVTIGAMSCSLVFAMLRMHGPVPRSVLVFYPVLLAMMMAGSRLAYRAWKEHRISSLASGDAKAILVLGAGDAGARLVAELQRSREWHPVGLLDDSHNLHGRMIQGVRVWGGFDALAVVAARLSADYVVVAMPSVSHSVRRRVVEAATAIGLKVLTVPSFDDLVSGRVTVSALRNVELDDLLGRDPVDLDNAGLAELIAGKTVMVTGAGGSIGLELCRQLLRFAPMQLAMVEVSEYALYQAHLTLGSEFPNAQLMPLVGDVKDEKRMHALISRWHPHVLLHAAAYKHVPLMETMNSWEAVRNNTWGTLVTARVARECGVERFVLISTDKAVNPTSVMGGSKRVAEMVCQALQGETGTQFVIVRFGNVLGSAGSVVPLFREQIARGGPVTVTHPEMTRYFMSIPEAARLVLQAGMMGKGGEIYVLDMGDPVRIVDLARTMIRLSGLSDDDISITFSGLRPGEKLYEEVLADEEQTLPTPHPKLRIAKSRTVKRSLLDDLGNWVEGPPCDDDGVRHKLSEWLPEYSGHQQNFGSDGMQSAAVGMRQH